MTVERGSVISTKLDQRIDPRRTPRGNKSRLVTDVTEDIRRMAVFDICEKSRRVGDEPRCRDRPRGMREVYRARDTKLNLDVAIRGLTIVDINGLPRCRSKIRMGPLTRPMKPTVRTKSGPFTP